MTDFFVLEIFCCSGGMAEGFRRAGLPVTMAIDRDPDACASYEANMGHAPIRMDARDLLRMARAGWRTERPIDLLIADPPCTPWSRAGKRLGLRDERDMLRVTVELVEVLRPRAYLIANIPGLDDEPNWPVVQETIGGLSRHGYCSADFARLDAADFGVPQHRVRPFWYGHLDGPCVVWPSRTHGSPEECGPTLPGIEPLRPWVTCREALGHLPPNELGKPIKLRRRACNGRQHGSVLERPARTVGTSNLSDGNVLLSASPRYVSRIDEPARVVTCRDNRQETILAPSRRRPSTDVAVVPRHPVSPDGDGLSSTVRATSTTTADKIIAWPWDAPATTISTDDCIPPRGHHPEDGSILSQPVAIKLSEKAAAILQGFPEGWTFCGKTKESRWSQIGMAMPPGLAEPVARAIRRAMGGAR